MSSTKPSKGKGQSKSNKKTNRISNTSKLSKSKWKHALPSNPFILGLIAGGLVIWLGVMTYYFLPISRTDIVYEDIAFETKYIDDNTIELRQQQVRQEGEKGTKEVEFKVKRTLAGREIGKERTKERIVKAPTNKTIAKGTKKFQFMWCSNGAYRYYSNEEFKNPNTGFTHQSPDFCSQNGQGQMTGLADTAPPRPATTNVYQRSSPTTTRCYDTGIYTSSFSCYSY